MALISSGVEKVRAYALSVGVGADGNAINEPLSVLVCWQSEHDDKLYQIYINGKLCGFTENLNERQAVVSFRSSWQSSICIEVFAVEPWQAVNDYSSEVEFAGGSRVRLRWIRRSTVPLDAVADIFSNDGSGEIDYQEPVEEGLPYWDIRQDKWGFGLSCFGASDFGYDGAGAAGFGRGCFGEGEFGFDSEYLEWESCELKAGEYQFGIKIRSKDGIIDEAASETATVIVLPAAKGEEYLTATSYDMSSNLLTFSI
ncbi:MAG: hypothetical protein K9M75_10095 [Phycisphaerae bacterium]|nr:hypothetical protein [Phycisphaerae bacterium]